MKQSLEGIRVLELGMWHAGLGGPAILGDLGTEVIKIEQPGAGGPIRNAKHVGKAHLETSSGINVWHEAANRNKKSIAVDLHGDAGREIVYRLVSKVDVFMVSLHNLAI